MDQPANQFAIPNYELHLISRGRGKGIATYFKPEFEVSGTKSSHTYQMCKISNAAYDSINVYRSKDANSQDFLNDLKDLIGDNEARPCIIIGDFNLNYHQQPRNNVITGIESWNFNQMIKESTHTEGGLLDHFYARNLPFDPKAVVNFSYFSDHAAISIVSP